MARPPKFDDQDVLDRATDLFWKSGADAVSIRDLEAALDLKAPSIYRRFHSKDQLLARCIDRYVQRAIGGRIRFFLQNADDPLGGLRRFFTSTLDPHPGEDRLRGCLLTTTAGSAQADTPEIEQAIKRGFSTIETAFHHQIEQATEAGQVDTDTDPEAVAKALMLSFQGLLVLARSGAGDLLASIDATFSSLEPKRQSPPTDCDSLRLP